MTDFTDIIKAQDRADEVLNANKAMINDGVESPNIPESAAQSVLLTEHPAQYEKTWEDMGRGEQIVRSLEFGYNNMKMAKAASEFMDANEASKIGLSAFADDIDGTDEESQKAVEALLAKDTAVNRQYKEEQADRAMASAYEYADLLRESTKFRAPSDLAKMQEAAKGKGFWEGLFDAGKVFFDGDVIGNSIYLAGTSFGAMAPYIVMATVGNKAAALAGMSAVGGAIAGAFMGVGSYQNEYGSYIADALKEKGYDLSDPESWRKALSDQATIDDLKYRASNRAMGVSVFDAIAGHASALHFRPATALRSLRKAEKNAPSFGVRVVDSAGNMTTQMAIQGALGGAGEAVGSLAAGDEVDPSAVFMEMVGELTGAPSEVLTIGVSSVNEYREDIQRVQEAKSVAKIAEQFTAAAEAVGMSLKNEEAIDAWAERVGDDKNMIAFGQDVVEQVNMQELEDVDPQLAEQVKEASEAKRSVEISVARITKIATKNRNLANALIRESKVRVDGMSPREAEEFEKTGKAEAEAQFDKILARSKGTRQQLVEAREIAADLSRQLQEAGTSKEVADLQVKPWEMMLANAARMLGTSPKDMAKRMNLRIERSEDGRSSIEFWQDRRGSYTPFNTSTNTYGQAGVITLMQESDKSTFMHESSHVWLDFHTRLGMDIADKFDRGEQLTAGEQEFLRTLGGFFKWGQQEGKISFGVDDTPESVMRAVRSWANLSIDEQRGMHELFADGFERYLIDGNSPSPEVASIFKRFASWLKKVYATAMRMPNPISPEVKKLYDLLFISEQEAADAEVRAGMVALFAADDAKVAMTDEERKQYADLNEEATLDAQGYVRKAVSGVMRVYTRLRQKEAERIYREHKERIDIRTEELMEEPRFIALDILTVGLKQKEGERIRMKLNADVLRMEGYSQETINALAEKGFVYDGRDHHDFISPKALAAQAGASDTVQLVKDLVNKKRAKAHSPLARAREMLTWGGSATKLNVRELTALGIDTDTIAELLVNDYAVDPAQVAQTGSAQQLAELCGHGNAVGLIGELLEIEPARMEATKEVHAQILQETGEKPEVYTQLQADLAAHNATRSRLLHAEHNAIARMLGKKQLMVKAAREYALQKIQSMRFAEVAPYIFVRDEKRCARLAEQAYIKGDFEACLEYKRAQILNMEMARAALELQNSYEKAVRHARAAVKSKTIHKPYQKLATLLIAKHDLAGTRGADIQGLENELGELLSEMAEGGTPVEGGVDVNPETGKAIPGALLLDTKRVKDMTVEEAQNLFDALRELVSVGRNIQKQTLLETKARVREVVSEGRELLAETAKVQGREPKVEEVPKGFWEKKLDWAKGFFVDHIKIATWCRIFDQNKENGFFWNLFIRSANKCANFESTERARVATELDKILTPIFGKKGAFDQDKIQIGKRLMSKGERFAVACNLGNDSNRERLVAGQPEQWTDETIEALCSSLSEAEWRAVQSVWSLFESYRPLIAAKQKRVYGEEPKWIERKPLTVTTADGKTITLHGGYYPVKYDPRSDLQVQVRDDASVAAAELRGAFQSSTTNRSFTKQRTAKPNGKRLRLDMQAMFEGLDDVIHDLAWHEWLIDTRRILVGVNGIGSGLQTTIKDLYGSHVARAFDSWRQDIAQGDRVPPGLWSGISGNVGVVAMGWNPMSALVQLTGVGYIVPRCGARNTLWALKKFMTNPRQARKTINAASKMMANRALTMNKNVAQIKGKLEAGRTNWVKENAYCMIIAVQGIVDTINWMAAYAKAMQDESVLNSENPDETAVAVADQIVIDTQGSGSTNDLAKVERDPRFDMFTVFYSWANAALNNSVALAKGETNRAKAMRDLLFMAVFMPTLEKIFRESLKAGDEEDEEDKVEELVMLPLKATVEYHLGMFVFARELSGAASSAVAGEPVYTYGGTAGTQGISAAVNLIGSASDPTSKRFLNASLDVTGAMLGLPTGQIKKTIKGIQAVESGQAEGLDAIKAPIFGYSGRVY